MDSVLPLVGSSSLALSFLLALLSTAAASRFANISNEIATAAGNALSNLPLSLFLASQAQSAITALRILEILAGRGALSKPVLIQLVPILRPSAIVEHCQVKRDQELRLQVFVRPAGEVVTPADQTPARQNQKQTLSHSFEVVDAIFS